MKIGHKSKLRRLYLKCTQILLLNAKYFELTNITSNNLKKQLITILKSFITMRNFSCNTDLHDLLLTVLWDAVVHTSANVRTTAAKMFEVSNFAFSN